MTLHPPFRVKAIYSWSGSEEDDLGFIEGDMIDVDSLGDGNWWHGKLQRNKMTGSFPMNYVEVTKSELFKPSRSTSPEPPYDEMQFSFQSSRSHYQVQQPHVAQTRHANPPPVHHQQSYQPVKQSSSRMGLPHSQSAPRLDTRDSYNNNSRSCEARETSAPPLPHHAYPVKKSQSQLFTPVSPYKREFIAPYDPETLNTSNSSSNVFSYSNGSYFGSSTSSQSTFAMSDFSATSAGSYSRHQWEEQQRRHAQGSSASGNPLLVEEKRVKNPGMLKKIFSFRDAPPLPSTEHLVRGTDNTVDAWIECRVDLNRANSIGSKERQLREKRIRETAGYIILEPHKQLSTLNNNEVYQTNNIIDLHAISLKHVDQSVRKLGSHVSLSSFVANDLGMKYSSKLEYIRALFVLCCEHFMLVDSGKRSMDEVFQYKQGSSYDMALMFQSLGKSMGIQCELIEGSLKTPQAIVRHIWNSVLINGEWRFIDVSLGNLTNKVYDLIQRPTEPSESFYFLAEPLDWIHTHIPDKYEHQHVVPPIDPMVALALPPCFPSFFKNGLKTCKFNNALTRLEGLEIFEMDLKTPKDIEVNASVVTKAGTARTLAQVYWKHNERYCRVKGTLPKGQSQGFIHVYSGPKGVQRSLQNIHPLSMVIPITHTGECRELIFVERFPTVPAQSNDIYIKQPQNKHLTQRADYVFTLAQHPSMGLGQINRVKLALQSPSGKILKFVKKDHSTPSGTWELPVKCTETGVWRALVSMDSGTSLCVFAEWVCQSI